MEGRTVGEVAEIFGVQPWTIARAADRLATPIPRRNGRRVVPDDRLKELAAELAARSTRRRGPTRRREMAA